MRKIIVPLLIIVCLICGCSEKEAKASPSSEITINMPKDDLVNGYRLPGYSANSSTMPETIKGEDTAVLEDEESQPATDKNSISAEYCGNKNSKVFHSSSCSSVTKMNASNKVYFSCREDFITQGYKPCGSCKP